MIKSIIYDTVDKTAIIEPCSEKHDLIRVFYGCKGDAGEGLQEIGTYHVAEIWQMIIDHLVTLDVGPVSSPILYRLKCEALAVLNYRH